MDNRVEPWMIRAAKEICETAGIAWHSTALIDGADQWAPDIIAVEYHREYIVTPLKLTKER